MENKIVIAETERLVLRRYKQEDLQDLFEYLSDKEVVEYEPYKPLTLNETKENLEWRIGTEEMIAVELKNLCIYAKKVDCFHEYAIILLVVSPTVKWTAKSVSNSNGVTTQMAMRKRIAIFYEEIYADGF